MSIPVETHGRGHTVNRRIALVTGAAKGIGAAAAIRLAENGDHVVLLDRDIDALTITVSACIALGTTAEGLVVDFSDDSWIESITTALLRLERVDVLVNNAGIGPDNLPEDWSLLETVLAINLMAPLRLTAICLDYMGRGASIINVSSILGKVGNPRNTGYCTSKHGIIGYTRALAMDVAARGITVNAVLPGFVDTPMLHHQLKLQGEQLGVPLEQLLRNARRRVPLKRFVRSEEVAATIAFLASTEASGITAQSIVVDGGATCGA